MRGPNKRRLSCCLKHIQLSSRIVIVIATATARQWDSQRAPAVPKAEPEPQTRTHSSSIVVQLSSNASLNNTDLCP